MPSSITQLVDVATAAMTESRTVAEPRSPESLARIAVEAILAPEHRDVLLAAIGARHVGHKATFSRVLHDDPRHAAPTGAVPVYAIEDPRNIT